MIIKAQDFSKRTELELKVKNLFGLTPELKAKYEIQGTREELEKLQLSDKSIFWGIKCVITDNPTEIKTQSEVIKPERGEIKKFKIN